MEKQLDADSVRAWSDAVGPTVMAFFGVVLVIVLLVIPVLRRDRKEGGNEGGDVGLYGRIARIEARVEILWDERDGK